MQEIDKDEKEVAASVNYRLTIDKDLIKTGESPAVQKLKRWRSEGKVELVEVEPKPGAINSQEARAWAAVNQDTRPGPKAWRRKPSKVVAGKINFAQVASVLFPNRDAHRLNINEVNDVAHLIKHHGTGNEVFITGNAQNFIENGRRERLKAMFGVIAMTPEEAVHMLTELEGWK